MASSESSRVLKENLSLALAHFSEHNEVFWVLFFELVSTQRSKVIRGTHRVVLVRNVIVVQRLNI